MNLTHAEARTIAEALWGRGGTQSEATNRAGAFYFHCSGHGGFVISWDAFTPEEQAAIKPHAEPEIATRARGPGRRNVLMHPYMVRSKRYIGGTEEPIRFACFEEDCAWCIPILFTGINLKERPRTKDDAQSTFDLYYANRA